MNSERLVLGIDGGGSSTRAALADESGRVLGVGLAGGSNPFSSGAEASQAALDAAMNAAFEQAGIPRRSVAAAALGIAGLVTPREFAIIERAARKLAISRETLVIHDLRVALAGGLVGAEGAVLVSGTGSACYARNAAGQEVITGGKGPLAGDSGSGYWIAHRALRTAVKQLDGRLPRGPLAEAVLRHLGISDPAELPGRLHRDGISVSELAKLSPRVVDLASAGDAASAGIVNAAYDALAEMLSAALHTVRLQPPTIVLAGGLATSDPFGSGLRDRISRDHPEATFPEATLPPVGGAVLQALWLLGIETTAACVERLSSDLNTLRKT